MHRWHTQCTDGTHNAQMHDAQIAQLQSNIQVESVHSILHACGVYKALTNTDASLELLCRRPSKGQSCRKQQIKHQT